MGLIDSVCASDNPDRSVDSVKIKKEKCKVHLNNKLPVLTQFIILPLNRPNSFVIITANRVIHCNSDTPEEMHHWISLLQKPKGDARIDGQEFLVRGKKKCKPNYVFSCCNISFIFFFFTAPSLFRLAAERGEDQREEHLPEAEEALVRADP